MEAVPIADHILFSTNELLISCTWRGFFRLYICFSSWCRTLSLLSRRNCHNTAVKLLYTRKMILQIWSYVKAQEPMQILLRPLTSKLLSRYKFKLENKLLCPSTLHTGVYKARVFRFLLNLEEIFIGKTSGLRNCLLACCVRCLPAWPWSEP